MEIHGEHLIHAPRDRVWSLLDDPAVLARITPGVTSLVPDGDDRYSATVTVALGPVKGEFKGHINITNRTPPEAMTLKLEARGPGGGVAATANIILHDAETNAHAADASQPNDAASPPPNTATDANATDTRAQTRDAQTREAQTRVAWSADPQLMGLLATVGGRLVEGVAKERANQFFTQLEREATSA